MATLTLSKKTSERGFYPVTKQLDRPIIDGNIGAVNVIGQVQRHLPGAKILLVKGYSSGNRDYSKAKAPVSTGWGLNAKIGQSTFETYKQPSDQEINNHLRSKGWIGAALDQSLCIVDIDGIKDNNKTVSMEGHSLGNMLLKLLRNEGYNFHAIQTPNGFQFVFKSPSGATIKNQVKEVTALGVQPDYRTAGGMIVWPTSGTENRFILHTCEGELDEVPYFLHPMYKPKINGEGIPNYPIYPFGEGSRNDSMNKFLYTLRAFGGEKVSPNNIDEIGHLVNNYFTEPSMDASEVNATIQSVLSAGIEVRPQRERYELFVEDEQGGLKKSEQVIIPEPFFAEHGLLKKMVDVKEGKEVIQVPIMVCRHIPVVSQSFSNLEKSQLHHEIQWDDYGRTYRETVPAGDISTRNRLLLLADRSLAVTDLNARELIDYFNRYILFNEIPRGHLVERLGHVKGGFIHPLMSEGIKIMPPDIGDKQTIEAFESVGTWSSWIESVFEQVRDHPKAIVMLLGSFASVLLNDLKLSPFIIDLSGPTSKGKTTILKVAASVWGNGHLVSEWNITKVAAERKAAFLNSFPLMLDDTMKADERQLKSFVYNFSGGRSKGRGSITGTQTEFTWNNLLLSTGETSLTEYAMQAGGAAARVLPITGLPFDDVEYEFFNELYEAIENHHGAIGIEFLKQWQDKKEVLLPLYKDFNAQFQKKSNGNEVLGRIARHYAALVFTAHTLNSFFQMEINLNQLTHLFDEMVKENTAIDKPMQMLEAILTDLDSKRESISGDYEVRHDLKAIYKDKTLFLLPAYLKEFLKTEQSSIRNEWLRRGLSIGSIQKGKESDSKLIKHCGKVYRAIPIQPNVVEELGFDFTETWK